jgi:hypothetical protein
MDSPTSRKLLFSELCRKSFSNPRDERDDDETNQYWPDSDPPTDDPWDGNCDFDENKLGHPEVGRV